MVCNPGLPAAVGHISRGTPHPMQVYLYSAAKEAYSRIWMCTMASSVWHSVHACAAKPLFGAGRRGSSNSSIARCSFLNFPCRRLAGARAPRISPQPLATHDDLRVQVIHALPSHFTDSQTEALDLDIGVETDPGGKQIFQVIASGADAVFDHLPVTTPTILVGLVSTYYLVNLILRSIFCNYFMVAPSVHLGEITAEGLRAYDGTDSSKPLLVAIKGHIYDVSHSRILYGPRGPYSLFAGSEASRALAKHSFEQHDLTDDLQGLTPDEMDTLSDWELKFRNKYPRVGFIAGSMAAFSMEGDGVPGGMDG